MSACWYAVRTQTNAEVRAVAHLGNQGFEVYLPRYRKQRRHARKVEMVLRPLFPGYVFVRMDIERQTWQSINGTVGVIGLVQFGGKLAGVPVDIVEMIRMREDEGGAVRLGPDRLKVGEHVRVRDGAFEDCVGILADVSDDERMILLLNLLGREVRVHVPVESLTRAS
jgi:transcriptional antiterminator RfaH